MSKKAALFLLLAVVGTTFSQDYCALCPDHTMCQYQPDSKCQNFISDGVSSEDIEQILNAHNELRSKVATGGQDGQPSAANMRKLTWDDELAAVAQRWSNQCMFGHDTCRKVERFGYGQNAFEKGSTEAGNSPDWRGAVQAWYDEVGAFNPGDISPFKFATETGHYTQVVWAETFLVGCGFTEYQQDGWIWLYYVCNYGPAGNVLDGTMYEQGDPCSQCDESTSCENGLCV